MCIRDRVDTDGMDADPAAGAYLFGLELTSTGLGDSDPTFFVVASGIEEETHEMAVDYVATAFAVPEPSTIAYIGAGLFALLAWRKRR